MKKTFFILILISLFVCSNNAQTKNLKDYFIPVENKETNFYKPDADDIHKLVTNIIYQNVKNNTYNIIRNTLSLNQIVSKLVYEVQVTTREVRILKTKSFSMVKNVEKDCNPPQIYIKAPLDDQTQTWTYTDETGDVFKCTSQWQNLKTEKRIMKALIVKRIYVGKPEVSSWASVEEIYVESIGLWRTRTLKGKNIMSLDENNYLQTY
ncbi:MAG: hypothetical protein JXQ69_06405 [Paludibacteraceae bacterium]|nr:hypothetical protein [Paludibacteraceae bacterium]MBN2787941.1 hypothetical protein [Paludibacteraceae bacterium]